MINKMVNKIKMMKELKMSVAQITPIKAQTKVISNLI